jgi:hypothetical protein
LLVNRDENLISYLAVRVQNMHEDCLAHEATNSAESIWKAGFFRSFCVPVYQALHVKNIEYQKSNNEERERENMKSESQWINKQRILISSNYFGEENKWRHHSDVNYEIDKCEYLVGENKRSCVTCWVYLLVFKIFKLGERVKHLADNHANNDYNVHSLLNTFELQLFFSNVLTRLNQWKVLRESKVLNRKNPMRNKEKNVLQTQGNRCGGQHPGYMRLTRVKCLGSV